MSSQNSIEDVYKMLTPANLIAAQKVSSKKTDIKTANLLDILYGLGNKGVNSIEDLRARLTEFLSGELNDDELKNVRKVLKFYSTGPSVSIDKLSQSSLQYQDNNTVKQISSMKEIVNSSSDLKKGFAIILSNTPYITPAIRNAEKSEVFLNYIPSIFASRMVPYFEAEFNYLQEELDISQRSSQIKFLLGNSNAVITDVNKSMINAISKKKIIPQAGASEEKSGNVVHSKYLGMEMFTSPQTLVNPDATQAGRYTQVLDPFRPFATIENFEVSVESTVGLFSYKKGTMVIKLHDKSRLPEISEFIQPVLNNNSAITVKYGWIYPAEATVSNNDGSSTYADFINNNFLIEEVYSVVNSSYSFDDNGQVSITLQIAMRSANELRNIKHTEDPDSALQSIKELKRISENIKLLSKKLFPDKSSGALKEIRGFQIIDAAERGTFPEELSASEVKSVIESLKTNLKKGNLNQADVNLLITNLETIYSTTTTSKKSGNETKYSSVENIKNEAFQKVEKRFNDIITGPDPFLVSRSAYDKFKVEAGLDSEHPYIELIEKYNKPTPDIKNQTNGQPQGPRFKKRLVSFGKLFSVFAGQTLQVLDTIDEFQVYFYQFNEKAGRAASTNIAEFPIELDIFLEHYKEHVTKHGTVDITLENFLMLVRDSQLQDDRALAYGFRDFFEPFEPGQEATLAKGKELEYESARAGFSTKYGPFNKPVIEFYAEAISKNILDAKDKTKQSILRLHIFDKNMTPFKTAASILKSDTSDSPTFFEVRNDFSKEFSQSMIIESEEQSNAKIRELISKENDGSVKILLDKGYSLTDIKKTITRTVPTIIIGGNASMIKSANLSSNADALLSSIQMMNHNKGIRASARASGSGPYNLPLVVIPASLSLTTQGCPLLSYSQQFFVDFNTGTTIDNIYVITGLKHSISPGKFETVATMTFYDAYGRYVGAPTIIDYAKKQLDLIAKQQASA